MNNDEVGKISYVVEIDTRSLADGTKSVEQSISGSLRGVENSFGRASNSANTFDNRIKAVESSLRPIASASAVASGAVVAGFSLAANAAFQQVRAVENASFGLRAYEKDADAVNTVLGQLIQFARSDAGVLFQREELFQAASTLRGFGEATSNLNDRVQILAKGVAVGNTTFAELSQIVGRSAQQGRLTAEAFDQLAYRGIILDSSLRGAAVGADQLYNAIDSAIDDSILSGRANTIDGLLTRLNSAWRDLGSTILGVDRNTSQFINGGLGAFITATIGNLTEFIRNNQALVAGVGSSIIVFGALTGGLYLATRAFIAARAAVVALGIAGAVAQARVLGLIGVLSAIAGIAVGVGIEQQLNNTTASLGDLNTELDDTTNFGNSAGQAVNDLTKQLNGLDEQIARVNRDYQENLARIVRRHQDSVVELTEQIERENTNYNAALRKRFADFQVQQGREAEANQVKTDAIQTQIDFLRRYDNETNRQKLTELQFALARENAQYEARNQERISAYNADAEAERLSYQQRQNENQKRLNEDLAVLNRHRDAVNSVRGVILLDEIETLRRSREEQLKSLQQQRQDIINSLAGSYQAAGTAAADAFQKALKDGLIYEGAPGTITIKGSDGRNYFTSGFASGGFTGRGSKYEVAGQVHKGEYVVPKEQVNQITGLPDFAGILSNNQSGGTTVNITLNPSGIFASSPMEIRNVANLMLDNINQTLRSKGIKELGTA